MRRSVFKLTLVRLLHLARDMSVGWSWRCLEAWGEFFSVTTYSLSMTFVLWICTEVGTFLGGLLSTKELSAFSISFQVEGFAWMVRCYLTRIIIGWLLCCDVKLTKLAFCAISDPAGYGQCVRRQDRTKSRRQRVARC